MLRVMPLFATSEAGWQLAERLQNPLCGNTGSNFYDTDFLLLRYLGDKLRNMWKYQKHPFMDSHSFCGPSN